MKQYYAQYHIWEDYLNGMYAKPIERNFEAQILQSQKLLSEPEQFEKTCRLVLKNWVIAVKVNLTNNSINKLAWLGQAACCYSHGAPEVITRQAWGKMAIHQQTQANNIARKIINEYLNGYKRKHFELY